MSKINNNDLKFWIRWSNLLYWIVYYSIDVKSLVFLLKKLTC